MVVGIASTPTTLLARQTLPVLNTAGDRAGEDSSSTPERLVDESWPGGAPGGAAAPHREEVGRPDRTEVVHAVTPATLRRAGRRPGWVPGQPASDCPHPPSLPLAPRGAGPEEPFYLAEGLPRRRGWHLGRPARRAHGVPEHEAGVTAGLPLRSWGRHSCLSSPWQTGMECLPHGALPFTRVFDRMAAALHHGPAGAASHVSCAHDPLPDGFLVVLQSSLSARGRSRGEPPGRARRAVRRDPWPGGRSRPLARPARANPPGQPGHPGPSRLPRG